MGAERGEVLGEVSCRTEVKSAFSLSLRHFLEVSPLCFVRNRTLSSLMIESVSKHSSESEF